MSGEPGAPLLREQRRRALILLLMLAVVVAAAASDPMHRLVSQAVAAAEVAIRGHDVAGAVAYVVLSAASAMFVFLSTAIVTPLAVEVFGPLPALLLLWLGWVLGGAVAYSIGRFLGHRVASRLVPAARLREYEARAARLVSFRHVLLFQLAVPSEIPGYVLGLVGCRFVPFVIGMALAELPFAIGAVYLGESFLERDYAVLIGLGLAGVTLSWIAFRLVHERWSTAADPPPSGSSLER